MAKEDKLKALDNAVAQIEKQYGKGSIMKLGDSTARMNVETVPTGCLSLDIALGLGGIPKGRIIEIYGPESSGKTTVALHMAAEVQKRDGIAGFIDAEHALDPAYASKIGVDIDTMNSAFLGVKGLSVKDTSGTAATYAIDAIADAVAKVSSQRSALGAVQNRLEHTIANVDNVVENSTSAESRIRDTDMAEEMVNYSKNNILAQAGQSMLAQANQSTQGVMSLLQ